MNKVRCQGCREYLDRGSMRRSGLGWVCPGCVGGARQRVTDRARDKTVRPARRRSPKPVDQPSLKTQLAVRDRDRHRCRRCGVGSGTQLHHINYRSEGVDHQAHNLVLLCQECHMVVHSDKRRWKPLLLGYVWCVYVEGTHPSLGAVERRFSS